MTPPTPSVTQDLLACWRLLSRNLKRRWLALAWLSLFTALLELATAAVLLRLIVGLSPGPTFAKANSIALGFLPADSTSLGLLFVGLLVVKTLFRLGETRWRETLTERTVAAFAGYLLHAWLSTPLARQLRASAPVILEDVQTTSLIVGREGITSLVMIFSESAVVLVLSGAMIAISPLPSLGFMAALALLAAAVLNLAHRRHAHHAEALMAARPALYGFLQGALAGTKEIRIAGAVPAFVTRFDRLRANLSQPQVSMEVWRQAPLFIFEGLFLAAAAGLLILMRGDAALPLLIMGLYAAMRLLPAVNRLVYRVFAIQGARPGMRRLIEAPQPSPRTGTSPATFDHSLEVADTWLTYPNRELPALAGACLTINPGEHLALVGPSGQGKSTLLLLLAGLLPPDRGTVLADGKPLQTDDPAWHALLGYVGQDSPLLDDTLRNNITLDTPSPSPDALEAAIHIACLESVIARLPLGLETPLGPGGQVLSGGERQRVAIARSLYRRPRLLLLDEATAFVDPPTEQTILAGLATFSPAPAVVFVTHRLSAARLAGRVAFFQNGQVEAVGIYEDLLAGHPAFAAFASGPVT